MCSHQASWTAAREPRCCRVGFLDEGFFDKLADISRLRSWIGRVWSNLAEFDPNPEQLQSNFAGFGLKSADAAPQFVLSGPNRADVGRHCRKFV